MRFMKYEEKINRLENAKPLLTNNKPKAREIPEIIESHYFRSIK